LVGLLDIYPATIYSGWKSVDMLHGKQHTCLWSKYGKCSRFACEASTGNVLVSFD